jgi:hypothetical protein
MTADKEKPINIEFRIHSIELAEKTFHIPEFKNNKIPDTQFDVSLSINIDRANKRIINAVQVKVSTIPDAVTVASVTVVCSFDVSNFEEVIIENNNQFSIPDPVAETLNILAIGTTRGVMFSEFKGTWLHNSLLPVIDPKSFRQT